MKGLLIKDFNLMKMQKKFFLIIVVMAIVIAFTSNDVSFILGYITFTMPLFTLSTMNYDEFDNGNAFLFTLPVSRKDYVVEKYCFGLLLETVSLALAVILLLLVGMAKGMGMVSDTLIGSPAVAAVMVVFLSVMIPLQIKFGAEKGRIAMIVVGGVVVGVGFGGIQILKMSKVDIAGLLGNVPELSYGVVFAIATAIVIAILLTSIKISIAIINKKEY